LRFALQNQIQNWIPGILLGVVAFAPNCLRADVALLPATSSPAQWIKGARAFDEELHCPAFPAEEDGTIAVFCQAEVHADGVIRNTFCFTNSENNGRYTKTTRRALGRIRYASAVANGEAVPVLFYASALFSQRDGKCEVSGFPNWGLNRRLVNAEDYISPQEILITDGWAGRVRSLIHLLAFKAGEGKGSILSFAADISAEGKASNVQILSSHSDLSEDQRSRLTNAYQQSDFIPGTLHGEPLAMQILEVFYVSSSRD